MDINTEFKYEIGGEKVARVKHEFLYYEEDRGTDTFFIEADRIFKYFLLEVLEKHGIENYWGGLELAYKTTEEKEGIFYLEEAKESLENFLGKGKEREAKEDMFNKNEEIFKDIFGLQY